MREAARLAASIRSAAPSRAGDLSLERLDGLFVGEAAQNFAQLIGAFAELLGVVIGGHSAG